ncbi:hypothetical protein [Specibacter sp. NPDC078692]|uniref:hypothetical protein n=1 Tax=Specibacter sp. NPDC078692 TaxID=3155818 RepID=UPI003447B279
MSRESIMLDGLEFAGRTRYGTCSARLDGWMGRPKSKGASSSRATSHGSVSLPKFNDTRIVTVTGLMEAKSHDDLHEWMDRVNGLLLGSGPVVGDQLGGGRLIVAGHGSTRWADVKWDDGTEMESITDTLASYQLRLEAVDSNKYGETRSFTIPSGGSLVTTFQRGNASAYPVVVVSGSMPGGYEFATAGGTTFRVTRALTSGTPHTIDMRNGSLKVGSSYVSLGVAEAGIYRIFQAAQVPVRLTAITTGSGTATAYVTDTYS